MQKNVGGYDRIARLVVGPLLAVTGITQKCPLNRALGIDTYRGETETDVETPGRDAGRPS
ncbi:hypothetical protein C474_12356 [Halogeometricum pallidum JCM 14848]|uniref:DUF2892 domain-containing protein n=1 Tax=Halogeometricum pallidum JCM 14848 TaxID=1227487 RepID=M0D2S8_HALPD|nr:DUF2892 domain-containing protein [Halogeometricum pallidum]ELZ29826.1 hypothetical protein C474_12356 [Halogeometricum pallidum JCM 14848]